MVDLFACLAACLLTIYSIDFFRFAVHIGLDIYIFHSSLPNWYINILIIKAYFYLVLAGYWWCLAATIMVESCVLSTILFRTNWENEVNKVCGDP